MSNWIPGNYVPAEPPGKDLTREDMARVSADDWADIRTIARGYCRTVDASRSRKRMDASATITHGGHASYGTDDISDDVTQDAVLIFAQTLRRILATCIVETHEPESWRYVRRDGQTSVITRSTLHKWAVHDAVRHNCNRLDVRPDDVDANDGQQTIHTRPRVEQITTGLPTSGANQHKVLFRSAFGDGTDYPILHDVLSVANGTDHLRHAGIWATVAQARHGGTYGSWRKVKRTKQQGEQEWKKLSERLRDESQNLLNC